MSGRRGADDGGQRPALGGATQGALEGGGQIRGSTTAVRRGMPSGEGEGVGAAPEGVRRIGGSAVPSGSCEL